MCDETEIKDTKSSYLILPMPEIPRPDVARAIYTNRVNDEGNVNFYEIKAVVVISRFFFQRKLMHAKWQDLFSLVRIYTASLIQTTIHLLKRHAHQG